MKLIKGTDVSPKAKHQILSSFTYRWTTDNQLADYRFRNLGAPTIAKTTDAQWLSEHAFYITKSGELSAKHKRCEPAYLVEVEHENINQTSGNITENICIA